MGLATLINNREGGFIKFLGKGTGSSHPPYIRRDHNDTAGVELFIIFEITQQHRLAINMVQGNIKIALNLSGMQIHGQHPMSPSFGDHIGHQFGGD